MDVSVGAFLDLFSEGRAGTMRDHLPHTAYFRRAVRGLAEWLGVPPTADAILAARRRLGVEAACAQLDAANVAALLVDTGYPPDAMPLDEMRRRLRCAVHEVFRIETCAERLLARRLPFGEFVEEFRRALVAAAPRCVAFKTIVAYRSGLDVRPWSDAACADAYARGCQRSRPTGTCD